MIMSIRRFARTSIVILTVALAPAAPAADLTIDWYTIDGGGGTSTGGNYALSGTIAQPDASSFAAPMTGGDFELVGGFWPVRGGGCDCPGDLNLDALIDADDLQAFLDCIIGPAFDCACADLDADGTVNETDVTMFVDALITPTPCP